MDKDGNKVFRKGWSWTNILIGACFVAGAWFIGGLNFFLELILIRNLEFPPLLTSLIGWTTFLMFVTGFLGFWLVIPAFQKWWKTDRKFAWISLVIAILILSMFIFQNRY